MKHTVAHAPVRAVSRLVSTLPIALFLDEALR